METTRPNLIYHQLAKSLDGYSAYQIAQMIAAEVDPDQKEFRRIKQRWQRWLSGVGLGTIVIFQEDLRKLELDLKIVERSDENNQKDN